MMKRECPECSSELVQARCPDNQTGPGMATGSSNYWRCSTCGGRFTAEQIRETKRAKSSLDRCR